MNDQRSPATKPLFPKASTPNVASVRPSAALQGATSAFLPKPSATTTGLSHTSASPTSAGARHAALAAGVQSQRLSPPTTTHEHHGQPKERSPDRGRLLQSTGNTRGIAAQPTNPIPIKPAAAIPVLPERSSSTIAARYASSQSTSPQRSPNRSPHRVNGAISRTDSSTSTSNVAGALSGALASMAASSRESSQRPLPTRGQTLDLEKVPRLPAVQASPGSIPKTLNLTSRPDANASRPVRVLRQIETVQNTPRLNRAQSLSNVSGSITRNLPEPSTTAIAMQGSKESRAPQIVHHNKRPPIPTRLSRNQAHLNSPDQSSFSPEEHRGMTVNNLADAMVASSLASSRAASPVKKSHASTSRRRSRSFSTLQELVSSYELDKPLHPRKPNRQVKPPRPMKHTLRKPSASDDEEPEPVKRGRRHWMRKHPNMHHEGDRKRWRDKVTESERRRYEGVFAANRGLLIGPGYFEPSPNALSDMSAEGNRVANVVVKDIWERSRLPADNLREIYDLVSPEEELALSRDQFVVGMWLIDQRLKGRKLPVKVSPSVWGSVRHPDGIKLKARGR